MRALLLAAVLLLAAPLPADVLGGGWEDGPTSLPSDAPANEAKPLTPVPPSEAETGVIGSPSSVRGEATSSAQGETPWRAAQGIAACLLVGLLLGLGVWMLKRTFPSRLPVGSGALMEVLARTPVGPKQSVVLLRVAGRILVVGVGPENLATLSEISDAGEVEKLLLKEARPQAGDFRARLAGVLAPFRHAPMGAFGGGEASGRTERMEREGAGRIGMDEGDETTGEIRALERKVASWRLEDGARE